MKIKRFTFIVAILASCITCTITAGQSEAPPRAATRPATRPTGFDRWEKAISAFEKKDQTAPPPKGCYVFTGSSTIAGWKTLAQDFEGAPVVNRGFGGSQIVDATHFADRIIFPYEPKMVFLRSGGNDIHAGKSAEEVFADYKNFVAKVRSKLPDTIIVFIGLNPAPVRWDERDANKKLNELVAAYSKETPSLAFVDCYDISLTADGQVREDLFVADRLHFNPDGYKLLVERVRPFVPAAK